MNRVGQDVDSCRESERSHVATVRCPGAKTTQKMDTEERRASDRQTCRKSRRAQLSLCREHELTNENSLRIRWYCDDFDENDH